MSHTAYDSVKVVLEKVFEYNNVEKWFEDAKKENTFNGYINFFEKFLELFNDTCIEYGYSFVNYRYGELELKVLEEASFRLRKTNYKFGLAMYVAVNESFLFNQYGGKYDFEFPPLEGIASSDSYKFYNRAFKKHKLLLAHI